MVKLRNKARKLRKDYRFNAGALDNKTLLRVAIALIAIIVVVIISNVGGGDSDVAGTQSRIEVEEAYREQDLGKEFSFPLKDASGETLSSIVFSIDKAELRNEIIVQNRKRGTIKGRTYLILNLKVKNDFNKAIEVDTRDYIRLTTNGDEEVKLAPEIHNDPVEVQAISTKLTRVAFTINEDDENLILEVGEINGDKEKVNLEL